jgi:hypothetical protein
MWSCDKYENVKIRANHICISTQVLACEFAHLHITIFPDSVL